MTFESQPEPVAETVAAPAAEVARPDFERAPGSFVESQNEEEISPDVLGKRICDFDLRIEGRPIEKIVDCAVERLKIERS